VAEPKQLKAINFDLDTARLVEVFGERGRRQAYAQLQRFFVRNGFEHRQWSGYVSIAKRTYLEMYTLIDGLLARHSWLSHCTNHFDVTDFMAQSDALDYIVSKQEDIDISEQQILGFKQESK
jgi:virulence-associated protein VapD